MTTIIICEKAIQAKNLKAAIGNQYGEILAASGHILSLKEPQDVNASWARWGTEVLAPPNGTYPIEPVKEKSQLLSRILSALKGASKVILATDADREGQMIGQEILDYARYRGPVERAIFTSEDPISLKKAFANLQPNSNFAKLYAAALARANADQIFNLTLTRTATVTLAKESKRVIGIGRVKTPTLAIVCRRHLAIENFRPETFYEIAIDIEGTAGTARLFHRPPVDQRIKNKTDADAIAQASRHWRGPVSVEQKRLTGAPPKPHSLTSLSVALGKHGISPDRTLELAQALYDTHKIATYPRTDTRYLPETMIADAPAIVAALLKIDPFRPLAGHGFDSPTIRKGKSGTFSDAGLKGEPHHAIIPNVNMLADLPRILPTLSDQERTAFLEIARAYLIACGPDHVYDQTTLSVDVDKPSGPDSWTFTRTGRVTIVPGWKLALKKDDIDEDKDEADGDDKEATAALPPFRDQDPVTSVNTEAVSRQTTPPKPITIASLAEEMANAWKYVTDPVERERLKEAKGIGQPSTRSEIIATLLRQKLIESKKGRAVPTDVGLSLFRLLETSAPSLVDPGSTARMEAKLDSIVEGHASLDDILTTMVQHTTELRDQIVGASASNPQVVGSAGRAPTDKMIGYAKKLAAAKGVKLTKEIVSSFDRCKAFIDAHAGASQGAPGASAGGKPSSPPATEKQMDFIRRLAQQGRQFPAAWQTTRPTMADASVWIEKNLKS